MSDAPYRPDWLGPIQRSPAADARWFSRLRQLGGEPIPLSERWQERFVFTLKTDSRFRAAVRAALEGGES